MKEGIEERRASRRRAAAMRGPSGRRPLESLRRDVHFGARAFLRRPGFAALSLLLLSVGIGAATALFSVVNGVLIEPFPYPDAEELVALWCTNPTRDQPEYKLGGPDYFAVEGSVESLSRVAMMASATSNLTDEGIPPMRANGSSISADLFRVLRIDPLFGRAFVPEENQGTHRVVILSHGLWVGRYGGDPDIVGTTITMNDHQVEVVGILPPTSLPGGSDPGRLTAPDEWFYWAPLDYTLDWVSVIGSNVMTVIGRLEEGSVLARSQEELSALSYALEEAGGPPGERFVVGSLRDRVLGDIRDNLWILMGAVALLLLMACGNVANLLLARAAARDRELAVRRALGAGRGRIVRQLLTEVLLLGSLGGVLGLFLARWGIGALLALAPAGLPRQSEIGIDGRVLLFTVGAVLLTTLVAGILPAARSSGRDPTFGLRSGGRGRTPTRERNRANRGIVTVQVALAAVLLVGAGLLTRSLTALGSLDPGFSSDGILVGQLQLPSARYGTPGRILPFYDELRNRLEALPGVRSAVISMDHPLQRTWWNGIRLLDQPPPEEGKPPLAIFRPVSDGYFETYQIPLLEGRTLLPSDRLDAAAVTVVNQAFLDAFFPDGHPIGQRVGFSVGEAIWGEGVPTEFEVVGVVGNVRFNGLRGPMEPAFHIPLAQFPYSYVKVHLAADVEPTSLIDPFQATVWSLDPDLPVSDLRTMDAIVADGTARDRFNALLLAAFACAALALAGAGIVGVLSYMVAQKRSELGIRLALGAEPGTVVAMVLRFGAVTAGTGLAVGLLTSLALGPLLASLLFGVSPRDPETFAAVTGILILMALGAALVPGIRAARTDPMESLRRE
jgi:putative ABC transport system permease protein